jgi:hypothetical protein
MQELLVAQLFQWKMASSETSCHAKAFFEIGESGKDSMTIDLERSDPPPALRLLLERFKEELSAEIFV